MKELIAETPEEFMMSSVFGLELTQKQIDEQRPPKPLKQEKRDRRRRGRKISRDGK